MIRSFSASHQHSGLSSALCCGYSPSVPLIFAAARFQGWAGNLGNQHMKHVDVKQHDGVDDIIRVKGEQQKWLNHEQYSGYSDSYLKRQMSYTPQYEYFNDKPVTRANAFILEICDIVYNIYGEAADALEEAEANPLHPNFAMLVETATKKRKEMEGEIDRLYATAHPTVKTMYDAMLVRRWQTLEDWIALVQKKREEALSRLSPEWIEEIEKRKGIAHEYRMRLKHLGTAMESNPVAFLENSGFTEKELALIERRKRFFRRTENFGANIDAGDVNPH